MSGRAFPHAEIIIHQDPAGVEMPAAAGEIVRRNQRISEWRAGANYSLIRHSPIRPKLAPWTDATARRAQNPDPDRRQPRHRACHRQAFFERGLARHHLFAPRLSGGLSVGGGAGGSHPGRSLRSRRYAARRGRHARAAAGRQAPRAGQQCRHFAEGHSYIYLPLVGRSARRSVAKTGRVGGLV